MRVSTCVGVVSQDGGADGGSRIRVVVAVDDDGCVVVVVVDDEEESGDGWVALDIDGAVKMAFVMEEEEEEEDCPFLLFPCDFGRGGTIGFEGTVIELEEEVNKRVDDVVPVSFGTREDKEVDGGP